MYTELTGRVIIVTVISRGVTSTIPQETSIDKIVNVTVAMQRQVQRTSSLSAPHESFARKCCARKVSLAKNPVYSTTPASRRWYPQGYAHSCRVADSTTMFQGLGMRGPRLRDRAWTTSGTKPLFLPREHRTKFGRVCESDDE